MLSSEYRKEETVPSHVVNNYFSPSQKNGEKHRPIHLANIDTTSFKKCYEEDMFIP